MLVLLWGSGCEPSKEEHTLIQRDGRPDFFELGDTDLMDRAVAEAKERLPEFDAALKEGGAEGFLVKKGFVHGEEGEHREHIWVNEVVAVEGGYEGVIDNDPVYATHLKLGEKVFVKRDEISDWMYHREGRLSGGFTMVALVYGTPEQESHAAEWGIDYGNYRFLGLGAE